MKLTIDMPIDGVKKIFARLTPQELQAVFMALQDRLESSQMMKLAESAFAEWNLEEDLYSNG